MMHLNAVQRALGRPVDIASLAALRVMFGLLIVFASLRFVFYGWVDRFYVKPTFHFHYWGFDFVEPLSPLAMHGAFWAMAALGAMIALGAFTRVALVAFVLVFSYVELIDVAMYLNHYYLVSLLGIVLAVTPCHRAWSVDAWRRPDDLALDHAPAWALYLVRFQVGIVYFFAALAKLQPDWLLHAQPLNIWLNARADVPLVGWALVHWEAALLMSWAGFLFDLTIVFWLSWRKSRPLAYGAVLFFHLVTGQLFTIGLFPLIMVIGATIFFEPDWPRRLVSRREPSASSGLPRPAPSPPSRLLVCLLASYLVLQVAMPLRTYVLYPQGPVIWHEQGMRWSWRVMVREKNGAVTYRVRTPDGRLQLVEPSRYLTDHQEREMSGQPDLIVQLAHHIGREYADRYGEPVEVRVDARASLNGRPAAPMIDPQVDLMTLRPGLAPAPWILPAPEGTPPRLSPPPRRSTTPPPPPRRDPRQSQP